MAPAVAAIDKVTLMNVLSALQFASMLPDDARADSVPARHAVAESVEMGLTSGEALREQTEGLLWPSLTGSSPQTGLDLKQALELDRTSHQPSFGRRW